jgi:hypothetical protein
MKRSVRRYQLRVPKARGVQCTLFVKSTASNWQQMTVYGKDFERLNIPVLAIDGY